MKRLLLTATLSLLTACTLTQTPMPMSTLDPDSQALTTSFTTLTNLNDNAYLATLATRTGSGAYLQRPEPATATGQWARNTWSTLGDAPLTIYALSAYHLGADVTAQDALSACQRSVHTDLSCGPTLRTATHATLARHNQYTLLILARIKFTSTTN